MVRVFQLGAFFGLLVSTASAAALEVREDGSSKIYARDGTNVVSTYFSPAGKEYVGLVALSCQKSDLRSPFAGCIVEGSTQTPRL